MVDIDRDSFNDVMKSVQPRVALSDIDDLVSEPDPSGAKKTLSGAVVIESLDAFDPMSIVKAVAPLNALYGARSAIRAVQAKAEYSDALAALLNDIVSPATGADQQAALLKAFDPAKPDAWATAKITPAAADDAKADVAAKMLGVWVAPDAPDEDKQKALNLIGRFVAEIVPGAQASKFASINKSGNAVIDERVSQIDAVLSDQLSAIMHAPNFQSLEATWRGLFYLVSRTETGMMLKLRVFNAAKAELLKDMEKAAEFDQSALFKMIYEAEYGTYGGAPYSMLVGGYEFGAEPGDIEFLKKITEVAAAAHAPFVSAAASALFGLDSYAKLEKPRDLKKIFEGVDLEAWHEFREMEDSRYVALVLPHALMRLPYGADTAPVEGIDFEEHVDGNDNSGFLWVNAAYLLAERITNAFAQYSWTAAIRGVEGGGLVEGLPLYSYRSDAGIKQLFCPTEVAITDRREKELNDLGFIALCHCKGSGKAAFFGGQTTNRPKKYISDEANANARISAMLPYILSASRFAHYIKVIMREKIGSFQTRATVESYLNTWIAQYVLLDDNATQEIKATYPLRSAEIVVTDVPGEPGSYRATVFLKPHFQLEELTTSIRLVADLPKA